MAAVAGWQKSKSFDIDAPIYVIGYQNVDIPPNDCKKNQNLMPIAIVVGSLILEHIKPEMRFDPMYRDFYLGLLKEVHQIYPIHFGSFASYGGKKEVLEAMNSKELQAKKAQSPLLRMISLQSLKWTMGVLMNLGSIFVPNSWYGKEERIKMVNEKRLTAIQVKTYLQINLYD